MSYRIVAILITLSDLEGSAGASGGPGRPGLYKNNCLPSGRGCGQGFPNVLLAICPLKIFGPLLLAILWRRYCLKVTHLLQVF